MSFALALFSAVVCGLILTAFAQMKQSVCAGLKKVAVVWSVKYSIVAEPLGDISRALPVLGVSGLPHKSERLIDDLIDDHRGSYSDVGDNLSDLRSFVFVNRNYDRTTLVNPVGKCLRQRFSVHKRDSASARARRQGPTVLELPEKRQHKIGELSW